MRTENTKIKKKEKKKKRKAKLMEEEEGVEEECWSGFSGEVEGREKRGRMMLDFT